MNGGQCKLIENVYSCQCTSQYSGVQCEKCSYPNIDKKVKIVFSKLIASSIFILLDLGCKPSCQNSGICTSIGDSYYCQCLSQYTGNSCQTCIKAF